MLINYRKVRLFYRKNKIVLWASTLITILLISLILCWVSSRKPGARERELESQLSELQFRISKNPAEQVLDLVNSEREFEGLEKVVLEGKLTEIASQKACDLLIRGYWEHEDPDGNHIWDLLRFEDYRYYYAGENLARDFGVDYKNVMRIWMVSPGHRENILGREFNRIGVGICDTYIVLLLTD